MKPPEYRTLRAANSGSEALSWARVSAHPGTSEMSCAGGPPRGDRQDSGAPRPTELSINR